jgi:hypothetical protein
VRDSIDHAADERSVSGGAEHDQLCLDQLCLQTIRDSNESKLNRVVLDEVGSRGDVDVVQRLGPTPFKRSTKITSPRGQPSERQVAGELGRVRQYVNRGDTDWVASRVSSRP